MSLQQQQQQQQRAYRSNNRVCDRPLIATPTPSTNSDYSSDAGEGHIRRVSLDVDSFSRTKNPDQMAKKRSRSMDTETAINGFRQLHISFTPPTAPIDTTTTNTATATATATTKTTHTADNSGIGGSGSGGNIHYQDYHCKNYHRYYYPPGWPPFSRTLAFAPIITPTEATTPMSTAPRRGRPRNSGNNNNKNNNGPRPSWPPASHYYHYHHPPRH
ncbi:MAG: hypothetical protein J3R72DRAFT_428469 [Linnemannia gamsii]|nr:MAG: hypothetical protein J3R72DRAFT_428469 [Linnemannia gamsii]